MRACSLLRALAALLASVPAAAGSSSELPYYGDQGLTPRWLAELREPIHRVAEFSLIDQRGEALVSAPGRSPIQVVNFFFSTCPGICPLTMQNLHSVQSVIAGKGRMLSLSVTPNIDSPQRLAAYAQSMGIDAEYWHLLTGNPQFIQSLARDAFFATYERKVDQSTTVHTEKVYLLDTQSHIRGVHNATSRADVQRLIEDLELLYGEEPALSLAAHNQGLGP